MAKVTGINHVTLAVSDLTRSIAFYADLLGFLVRNRTEISAYLEAGSFWLALVHDRNCRQGPLPEYSHVAFTIDASELAPLANKLISAGAISWQKSDRANSFYFLDPDGHKLELHSGTLENRLKFSQ